MAYELAPINAPTAPGNADSGRFGVRADEILVDYKPQVRQAKPLSATPPAESGTATPAVESASGGTTLSAGAAALARKEQQFRREQAAAKLQLEQANAAIKELEELRGFKKKLEAKDFTDLEALVPYDAYTDYHINKLNGTSPEQEEIKAVKSDLEAIKKDAAARDEKTKQAALAERKKVVLDIVEKSADFSSIKELKMQDAVMNHIVESWEKDGIELTPEDACKEVEAELVEQAKQWTGLSKLKATQAAAEPGAKRPLPPLKPAVTTLTNSMAATGEIARPKKSYANMSETERYKEALRRVQETTEASKRKA